MTTANGRKEMLDWETYRYRIAEWIGNQERGVILIQYTGLKDKNGKEIYEGDVIKRSEVNYAHEVIFKDAAFCRQRIDDKAIGSLEWPQDFEVIGNIYENPELLK